MLKDGILVVVKKGSNFLLFGGGTGSVTKRGKYGL